MISPLNPTEVPAIIYEYLFYPPSSDQLWPPAQRRAWGLLSGSSILGYMHCRLRPILVDTPVMTQNSRQNLAIYLQLE
jgi:hypothetical protein